MASKLNINKESQSQQAAGYSMLQLGTTKNNCSKLRSIRPNWSNKDKLLNRVASNRGFSVYSTPNECNTLEGIRHNKTLAIIFTGIIIGILLVILVYAAPVFTVSETTTHLTEDQISLFTYNFSANVTNDTANLYLPWAYTLENISSNLYLAQTNPSFYSWITINSLTGVMAINATNDNQTGKFNITIKVLDSNLQGSQRTFYFIANATNDAPVFTGIASEYNLTYNLTQAQNFIGYLNATDEEGHYPLVFSINFTNCSLANWSIRSNCSLLSFISFSNNSVLMNHTPALDDVGIYYANISVMDYGANYNCSSGYCLAGYSQNKTTYYSSLVTFNVFTTLGVNVSNCENKIFQENVSDTCYINITTKGSNNNINLSSVARVRNYPTSVYNSSWFYSPNLTASVNFQKVITINVTPKKTEIGNWTINFTVNDLTSLENSVQEIHIYVNRTLNDVPELVSVANKNTSINFLTRINITVYDDDFFIPDKLQGYNETLNFTVVIMNRSQLSQQLNITNFSVQVLNMPVAGTNRTEAKIEFTPNSSEVGNYTINLTVRDRNNALASNLFNLTIISNNAPSWNQTMQTVFVIYEKNNTYLNLSRNVTDADGDIISFSFTSDTSFTSFSINANTGIINFTPINEDIGQHIVTMTANDGYLSGSIILNFTVFNVNDMPYLERPVLSADVLNASVDSNSNINATEDNNTMISIWIQDDDFKIPLNQKNFYNETLAINLTIQGVNSSILQFVKNSAFPTTGNNRSKYEARFMPKKSDIGNYNITINVSDSNNQSTSLRFNLTIASVEHSPVLMNLANQTSAVNRTLYYRINATDTEDGGSNLTGGNTNFTFSYNFLSGRDFINNNSSIFNRTTGELNITFNSTQGGIYNINITVNDSSNRIDSKIFWIFVYDVPVVISPLSSYNFSLAENQTYNFTFALNHSVGNNLSVLVYIENGNSTSLLSNQSFFGNSSNSSFQFTPNFTDETTYSKNLTLIAYAQDSLLVNRTNINITQRWNILINHTNYPLGFSGNIGSSSQSINGSSPQQVTLSDYFSDFDASDPAHNQSVGFIVNLLNSTAGSITISVTNWTNGTIPKVTFSASSNSLANFSVTGYEFNESNSSQIIRNITSNNFSVELTITTTITTVQTPSSGGGGGSTKPVSFKLTAPTIVYLLPYQKITVPINIKNKGDSSFYDIKLSSIGYRGEEAIQELGAVLDINKISSLNVAKTINFTLNLSLSTNKTGNYKVIVSAVSSSPKYEDSVEIKINVKDLNRTEIEKYILFTEEYLVQNPECIELSEILDKAKAYFDAGDYANARAKSEQVLNACKEFISQVSLPKLKLPSEYGINELFIIATIGSVALGIFYYMFSRRKLRKSLDEIRKGENVNPEIKI